MNILDRIKKSRPLTAIAWETGGAAGKQIVGLLVTVILARLLSPADFGLIGMAIAFIAFSQIFVRLGFPSAIIQLPRSSNVQLNTIFLINCLSGVSLTLLFFIGSDWIGTYYQNDQVSPIVKALSFLFVLWSLGSVQEALLRKKLEQRRLAQATVLGMAVGGIVAICLAVAGYGVWGLVAQQYLIALVRNFWVWRTSLWRPGSSISFRSVETHFRLGFTLFASGSVTAFFSQVDTFILGRLLNAEILGQFYRARSFMDMGHRFLSRPVGNVFFPYVSSNQDDLALLADRVRQIIRYLGIVLCPVGVVLFFLAEPLVLFLFGDQWLPSVPLVKILVFLFHVSPISTITGSLLAGRGHGRHHLGNELTKRLIYLICVLAGFSIGGLEGYLWGWVIAGNLGIFINIWSLNRSLRVSRVSLLLDCFSMPVFIWVSAFICYGVVSYFNYPSDVAVPLLFGIGYLVILSSNWRRVLDISRTYSNVNNTEQK